MKKRLIVVAIALLVTLTAAFAGNWILGSPEPAALLIPLEEPLTIYRNAIGGLNRENGAVSVEKAYKTVTGNGVFTEISQQQIQYQDYSSVQFSTAMSETLSIDAHTTNISEIYADGMVYATVNGSKFQGQIDADEYRRRLVPVVLLDANLYDSIRGFDDGSEYLLLFDQPKSVERWAEESDSLFAGATGSMRIRHDGTILESLYCVTYIRDDCTVHYTVSAKPATAENQVAVPEDKANYVPIAYLDGPRMLERATGYLMQAKTVSAAYEERIYCQAFGDERTRNISLHSAASGNWSAMVDTKTELRNTGRTGDVVTHLHEELFTNGVYTIRADGGEITENTQIDPLTMQTYCQNQLISTIMLPENILNATCNVADDRLRIEFAANEEFANIISTNACQLLYQKPEVMKEIAEESRTDLLSCYLELDKTTGLPLSSGIEYKGSYWMEGLPYILSFRATQNYEIPSSQAIDKINEAAGR